jgi:hypothetical protein
MKPLLLWKSNKYYILVRVCMLVRACVHVGTRARARVQVHIALLNQHATRKRHIVTSFLAPRSPLYFSTLSDKRRDFRKKVIGHKMYVFIFSTAFV